MAAKPHGLVKIVQKAWYHGQIQWVFTFWRETRGHFLIFDKLLFSKSWKLGIITKVSCDFCCTCSESSSRRWWPGWMLEEWLGVGSKSVWLPMAAKPKKKFYFQGGGGWRRKKSRFTPKNNKREFLCYIHLELERFWIQKYIFWVRIWNSKRKSKPKFYPKSQKLPSKVPKLAKIKLKMVFSSPRGGGLILVNLGILSSAGGLLEHQVSDHVRQIVRRSISSWPVCLKE